MAAAVVLGLQRALVEGAVLFGRAGGGTGGGTSSGGGSFSGGGSSGGGSFFGGSSGGVGGIGFGILIFGGVTAFVIYLIFKALMARRVGGTTIGDGIAGDGTLPTDFAPGSMGSTFDDSETARATSLAELQAGEQEIRAHDPAFDPDALVAGLQNSFYVVQQGWQEKRPELTRSVMSDAIWNAHRLQIDGYVRSKQTNMMDGIAIQYANLVAASSDGSSDTIVIRFFVKSADYVVDDEKGGVVRGHRDLQDWCEDWVYQRSARATTNPEGGLLQRKCPNCGAPLDVTDDGACRFCRAPVMAGEMDWVLVRIDQLPSWEWAMANLPK